MTETRSTELTIPADPADPQSEQQTVMHAGQVWFPDSAFKTAQFINDVDRERLPLLIIANWRGFSGGQRDLFESVIKFGAMIVDALRKYHQPVFIYIPPDGELRGGSWVVLDTNINPEAIEMYADPTSRGSIMEPSGVVNVKFRQSQLTELMRCNDSLLQQLIASNTDKDLIDERIRLLTPIYTQVVTHFADCHDRPGRMLAKGSIRAIVPWKEARKFFYHRLCKRLEI